MAKSPIVQKRARIIPSATHPKPVFTGYFLSKQQSLSLDLSVNGSPILHRNAQPNSKSKPHEIIIKLNLLFRQNT